MRPSLYFIFRKGGKGSSSAKGSQGCTIIKQHEKESLIRQSPREKPLKEVPLFSVFAREVTKDSRSKVRNSVSSHRLKEWGRIV